MSAGFSDQDREAVVELLRCAADLYYSQRNVTSPTVECDPARSHVYWTAWSAIFTYDGLYGDFGHVMLEAAAAVEDRLFP